MRVQSGSVGPQLGEGLGSPLSPLVACGHEFHDSAEIRLGFVEAAQRVEVDCSEEMRVTQAAQLFGEEDQQIAANDS